MSIWNALELRPGGAATLNGVVNAYIREIGYNGVFSLTIILIGLIVVWMGYLKTIRWTWPIMFIIAFGWAFAGFVLPMIRTERMMLATPLSELLVGARQYPGEFLDLFEPTISFALMVIALFLPVKAFFFSPGSSTTRPSL
jgi:hypothetical protein